LETEQVTNTAAQPKISVVIPVLNGVKTLERAIRSVIEQNYPNYELIILDAGSTDGTLEIIQRFAANIYYWHSKPDGSAYLAINMGAEKATGEIIAQLMADDWFEPGIFEAVAGTYSEHPTADIYSCGGQFVRFDETTQQYKTTQLYNTPEALSLSFYNVCFAIPAMSSRFVKKALIDKIGLFQPIDPQGKHIFSADREFLLRSIASGAQNQIVNKLGHTYFAHAGSATFGKNRIIQLKICLEHMAIAEKYLSNPNLTAQQYSVLRYWYIDQSVRYVLFNLLQLDFKNAWLIATKSAQKFQLRWPIALFATPCKIAAKKGLLYFTRKD
jgi:glycosyltransferase involved in cell wall biosynthesis